MYMFLSLILSFLANCLSCVPCKGTVGASGDLAPLSHLALGLMGEGRMWSPETGWGVAMEVGGTLHDWSNWLIYLVLVFYFRF